MERKLKIEENYDEQAKSNRESIKRAFNNVECFLMPGIGEKGMEPNFNGCVEQLDTKFSRNMTKLIDHLLNPENIEIKKIKNKELTCGQLIHYFRTYTEIFNSEQLLTTEALQSATAKAVYQIKLAKLKVLV